MEFETETARTIRVADDSGSRYDSACKNILSNKPILAWILKSCVEEYRNIELSDIETRDIEGIPEIEVTLAGASIWALSVRSP